MPGQAPGHRPTAGTSSRGRALRAPADRKGKNPAMNEKRKWITAGRLRRGAVILATAGLVAGAGLAAAGSALAAVGSAPGQLEIVSGGTPIANGGSGSLTASMTWATTTGCPSGQQTIANVVEF